MESENKSYGLAFAVLTLLIIFLGSKGTPGTQSAFGGLGSTLQTTPGLWVFGIFMAVLIVILFIPKEK